MVIGAPKRLKIVVLNESTGLPADPSAAADVDLVLLSNNQVVGKYGTGTGLTPVEKPSNGIFIVPFTSEVTGLLHEGLKPILEGVILPGGQPIQIIFSPAVKIRRNGQH